MPLQATALALALVIEAALGSLSFPLDIGYGLMPRAANGNLQVCLSSPYLPYPEECSSLTRSALRA